MSQQMEARTSGQAAGLQDIAEKLQEAVSTCILGKDQVIRELVAAVLAGGHVLLEDLPGTGKTTLAKALAKAVDGQFRRIQFTPDLLPSELTGINYFNQKTQNFEFRPGALFTNILLGDEINRATPRTQSSLLECMEERQVTVDGVTYKLEAPFLVLATQNPVEIQGTFPLPEAQLDRFLMRLTLGYPAESAEAEMLRTYRQAQPLESLEPVISGAELVTAMRQVREIPVSAAVRDYIVQLTAATRTHSNVRLGVSPRGSLALQHAAQAFAAMDGESYVLPDHVQQAVLPVLPHRMLLRGTGVERQSDTVTEILQEILEATAVPTEAAEEGSGSGRTDLRSAQ